MKLKFLGAPVFPHWLAFAASIFFIYEYGRLASAADAGTREIVILVCWVVVLIGSVAAILVARKRNGSA
jgi:hypothetical protein